MFLLFVIQLNIALLIDQACFPALFSAGAANLNPNN